MNWVKFKCVIDLIKGLMTHAAFDQASRNELCQAAGKQRFLKTERGQKREFVSKECIVSGKVAFLRKGKLLVRWVTLLVLTILIAG